MFSNANNEDWTKVDTKTFVIGHKTMEEEECTEARKDLAGLKKNHKENNVAEDMENVTGENNEVASNDQANC